MQLNGSRYVHFLYRGQEVLLSGLCEEEELPYTVRTFGDTEALVVAISAAFIAIFRCSVVFTSLSASTESSLLTEMMRSLGLHTTKNLNEVSSHHYRGPKIPHSNAARPAIRKLVRNWPAVDKI